MQTTETQSSTTIPSLVDAQYLASAAATLQRYKQLSYAALRVPVDGVALDLGCGPGTDTIPLAQQVVSQGRMVGVDADATMIAAADQRAVNAGVSDRVTHHLGDATRLPFVDNSFDAARSERLFQHLDHPEQALAEMIRVTRPGGRIVVLDTDWATASIAHPEIDVERMLARVRAERYVRNGYAARTLYRLFREQRLQEIELMPLPLLVTEHVLARELGVLDQVEELALAMGAISLGDLALWLDGLLESETTGTFLASVTMLLVVGQKSPHSHAETPAGDKPP
jgi:ubiquinone/menaquinone biosynthesis C-methylase UbiE